MTRALKPLFTRSNRAANLTIVSVMPKSFSGTRIDEAGSMRQTGRQLAAAAMSDWDPEDTEAVNCFVLRRFLVSKTDQVDAHPFLEKRMGSPARARIGGIGGERDHRHAPPLQRSIGPVNRQPRR